MFISHVLWHTNDQKPKGERKKCPLYIYKLTLHYYLARILIEKEAASSMAN